MWLNRVRKLCQSLKTFSQDNGLSGYCTSCGKLRFLKRVKNHFTLLFVLVGEKKRNVTLEELTQSVCVGLEGIFLISTKGHFEHAIFSHHELAVGQFLL
jgi:hypothetical protein